MSDGEEGGMTRIEESGEEAIDGLLRAIVDGFEARARAVGHAAAIAELRRDPRLDQGNPVIGAVIDALEETWATIRKAGVR